jgi:uncharacterized protein (TIGR01777 family)
MLAFASGSGWLAPLEGNRAAQCYLKKHNYKPAALPRMRPQIRRTRLRRSAGVLLEVVSGQGNVESVVVTGGTGFVGRALVRRLLTSGKRVTLLARNEDKARKAFNYKVDVVRFEASSPGEPEELVLKAVSESDAVINLAGEPISEGRWTPQRKERITQSRVNGTRKLVRAIQRSAEKPQVFISTSAVGFYGTSETITFDENTQPASKDFLASVAIAWEEAAQGAGIRTVINRFGIVLGPDGGALSKMLPLFNLFVGGTIGSGAQWVSWIHLADLIEIIVQELDSETFNGVYNATAPKPVRFKTLCDALASALRRPSWLPVPGLALQLLLGEAAELVLKGQRVVPKRILQTGFEFQFEEIQLALEDIVASWKSPVQKV